MTTNSFRETYGPVALITGASSGIGWAFAEALAARGLDLVLVARRADRLEALAAQLKSAHGTQCTILPLDLATREAPAAILAATATLDVGLVISNAGYGFKGEHSTVDPVGLTDMLMVNCNMPIQLTHDFIPRLKARCQNGGGGGLVLVSSVEGYIGCPGSAAYSASKALVIALGEALWGELEGTGVDILTLCPGATESEAAAKQGVDPALMKHIMPASDVAEVTLAALPDGGPTFCAHPHYRAMFEDLVAMPRRDALRAMAAGMKQQP